MRKALLLFGVLAPFVLGAQVIDGIPVNKKGKVQYREVVEVKGEDADELLYRAYFYQLEKPLEQMETFPIEHELRKKVWGRFSANVYIEKVRVKMTFTLILECKDGRYRYTITDLAYENYPSVDFPAVISTSAERLFDRNVFYNHSGQAKIINQQYMLETFEAIKQEKARIKTAMAKPVVLESLESTGEKDAYDDNDDDW